MKISKSYCVILGLFVFGLFNFSFFNQDLLEWSESKKLSFADFKGKIPAGAAKAQKVNMTTIIAYEIREEKGKAPQMKIMNFVDRGASWTTVKKPEILQIQQIKFDYSELYARKIRKKMLDMNKKNIKEKQKYLDEIGKMVRISEKRQRESSSLLNDQPHLIKIMQKDISDSLNLYKNFKK